MRWIIGKLNKWKYEQSVGDECTYRKFHTNIGTFIIHNKGYQSEVFFKGNLIYLGSNLENPVEKAQSFYESLISKCFIDSEFKEIKNLEWKVDLQNPNIIYSDTPIGIYKVESFTKDNFDFYRISLDDLFIGEFTRNDVFTSINDAVEYVKNEFENRVRLNLTRLPQDLDSTSDNLNSSLKREMLNKNHILSPQSFILNWQYCEDYPNIVFTYTEFGWFKIKKVEDNYALEIVYTDGKKYFLIFEDLNKAIEYVELTYKSLINKELNF